MNPTRQRRLLLVLAVLAAAAIAIALVVFALQQNMNYLLTPSQVLSGQADRYPTFRLGGMVKAGSIHRGDALQVSFTVVDADASMPVAYAGILPDLFRDNQSVIATGHLVHGRFLATEVLAKHDETYMPRELKDAMDKAHQGRKLAAAGRGGEAP